jgi:hypothetical protein
MAVLRVTVKVIRSVDAPGCSCGLTEHHAMKTYWGTGGIAPRILDLGTRWSSAALLTEKYPLLPIE